MSIASNGRSNVPIEISFGSRDLEMAAFDRLPAALRALVREAPFNVCALNLLDIAASGVPWWVIGFGLARNVQQFLALPREQTGWPGDSG
jgi:hypothetical protein